MSKHSESIHVQNVDGEDEEWTVSMELWGDNQVFPYITHGGVIQDVIPVPVATRAVKLWNQWMQQL